MVTDDEDRFEFVPKRRQRVKYGRIRRSKDEGP